MKYLTIEEIVQIHDKLIEQFGGEKGIVDKGGLDFIVNKVQSAKTEIYHKAAMLLYEIIITHPFVDGNKRTAAAYIMAMLEDFKYRYDAFKIDRLVLKITKNNITDVKTIRRMIKNAASKNF